MREHAETVHREGLRGSARRHQQVLTDPELNEKLARGNVLVVHVKVLRASGTTPTITVTVQHSSNNADFETNTVVASATSLSTTPVSVIASTDSDLAGFARLKMEIGGTNSPTAYARIYVTSRDT